MTTTEKYERLLAIARALTEDVNCWTRLVRHAAHREAERRCVIYEAQGEGQPVLWKLEADVEADADFDTILDALIGHGLLLVERKKADAETKMALLNAALGDCARVT